MARRSGIEAGGDAPQARRSEARHDFGGVEIGSFNGARTVERWEGTDLQLTSGFERDFAVSREWTSGEEGGPNLVRVADGDAVASHEPFQFQTDSRSPRTESRLADHGARVGDGQSRSRG